MSEKQKEKSKRRLEGEKSMISQALRKYHKKEFGPTTIT